MKEHRMSSIMRHYRAQKTPEILLNTQRCQSSSEKFCQQRPKIKQKFALKIEFREGDSYSHFLQEEREKQPWKQHERGTRHKELIQFWELKLLMVSYLVHYDTLLQNLQTLQNATIFLIQNASDVLLQNAAILLTNATVITN